MILPTTLISKFEDLFLTHQIQNSPNQSIKYRKKIRLHKIITLNIHEYFFKKSNLNLDQSIKMMIGVVVENLLVI
jgi:hypothetical protein